MFGDIFLTRDAFVLHQRRDDRQGQRDAVLHQHLGHVRIHAQLEGDGQVVGAVVGALRRHVHHALDAADLLLDRRGHGVAHGLGVGSGIDGRHLHGGRRHFGILRDRQREHGHAARQHDDHGDDRGEDRADRRRSVTNHRTVALSVALGQGSGVSGHATTIAWFSPDRQPSPPSTGTGGSSRCVPIAGDAEHARRQHADADAASDAQASRRRQAEPAGNRPPTRRAPPTHVGPSRTYRRRRTAASRRGPG